MPIINKRTVVITVLLSSLISIVALFLFFDTRENKKVPPTDLTFSQDVVVDGDHYKINDPILQKEGHIYLSLTDLTALVPLTVKQKSGTLQISYREQSLFYEDAKLKHEGTQEEGLQNYIESDGQIYLPDNHLEKYLGLKMIPFIDEKTRTVAIQTPEEQQKVNYDQMLGTTLFVHRSDVVPEKFEPRSGLYLGGYVLQDEFIQMDMEKFNTVTEKKHASFFKYVGYGEPFPKEWVQEVIDVGGFPHIAWEPNEGLEQVQNDEYLKQFAQDAHQANIPILLRYASEMNGTWTFYSGNSELYIEKWRMVHGVMKEYAPNVMMLWNVFTMPETTIKEFYPGDDFVDYVGVNIYNVVYHSDQINQPADSEDPLRLLDYVYNEYSHKKPIVIGEFGATNYNVTDGLYHVDFAVEKINRMYKHLPHLYPRVKNIYYFDVNNLVNAPEGRKINNYAITENPRILEAYAKNVAQPEYLTTVTETDVTEETFSYRDFLFYYENELFVDQQFVRDFLGLQIEKDDKNEVELTYNGTRHTIKKEKLTIDKAAYFEKREINGVSLDEILEKFNLSFEKENQEIHIFLNQ